VIAAERATQYALTWFSFVISFHTVLISVLPYTASPIARPRAPIIIIQIGIPTSQAAIVQKETVSYIAANGPIAFATSFAQ